MPNINPVSFTAPTDYGADILAIERRRKMAELMQQQSNEPLQTNQMAGGYVVPIAPTQGLAKVAQALVGAYGQYKADTEQKDVAKRYQSDLVRVLGEGARTAAGTPAQFKQPDPQEFEQAADQGGASPAGFNIPAKPGDPNAAAGIYMQHPATQALGMQEMQRQRMMEAFGLGAGAPTSGGQAGTSQPGASQPMAPMTAPQSSGMLVPREIALQLMMADSSGKLLAEANAKAHAELQKPVNVRPGGSVAVRGPDGSYQRQFYQPQVGAGINLDPAGNATPIPGYAGVKEGVNSIPNPSAPPVKIPLSGGQTAELSQPEYLQFQQTGQLPARYGQQPQPARQDPLAAELNGRPLAEQEAIRQVAQAQGPMSVNVPAPNVSAQPIPTSSVVNGGLGVPGLTQSQDEANKQAEEQARAKRIGTEQGGLTFDAPQARAAVADAASNLQRLKQQAQSILGDPALARITGVMGVLPNMPGGHAADVQAKLDTLKSQAGFGVLQAMRAASKTGGALGNVSDRENDLLQRNLAPLEKAQSEAAIKEALRQIIDYADASTQRMQRAYTDQYERVLGNQGMEPTTRGAVPVTGAPPQRRSSDGKTIDFGSLK